MPAVITSRAFAALLSTALLVASFGSATVAQEPEAAPAPIAPPSLELALAGLVGSGALLAGDGTFAPAKVRLPACEYKDVLTRYHKVKQWKRTLLDTNLKVKRSYKPWDLVSVSRASIAGSGKVRRIIIKDLKALATAARKAGKPLAVRSAYRSYEYQQRLFDSYVSAHGFDKAARFSARPGHSEHQMGTTIDFTVGPGVPLSTRFGDTPSGKWLARNGWKYGFIMSYPEGKRSASCYGYEPWHWRYFGRDLARSIHQSGQVPRRYLYENFETAPQARL
jgi:D-alanyl-D-alanine carboxypeptidase